MRKFVTAVATSATAIVILAAPAWAHVTLDPNTAVKGSDAVLHFTVPNEQDTATTTKLVLQFPQDHPIADALVEPVAGWTADVTMTHVAKAIQTDSGPVNDAVKEVTWTATGSGIAVGDFQQFAVAVGLPDDADSLSFPAIQTYTCLPGKTCKASDLTVQWVEQTPPGGPEPDHPAPVLTMTAGTDTGSTTPTTVGSSSGTTTTASSVKKSDVDTAKTVAIIAIIVAAIGLVVGVGGVAVGRRSGA